MFTVHGRNSDNTWFLRIEIVPPFKITDLRQIQPRYFISLPLRWRKSGSSISEHVNSGTRLFSLLRILARYLCLPLICFTILSDTLVKATNLDVKTTLFKLKESDVLFITRAIFSRRNVSRMCSTNEPFLSEPKLLRVGESLLFKHNISLGYIARS